MKIAKVETLVCDAGWRPWVFVKITTDLGAVGYAEITDSNGSPRGMMGVVEDLRHLLVGRDPLEWARREAELHMATRQSPGGIVQKAIAGCVNAMLDIAGKYHNVPVYALFGGPMRRQFPVYWSHFGTTRARAYEVTKTPQLKTLEDFVELLETARQQRFSAVKTNIISFSEVGALVYHPGFGKTEGGPELNLNAGVIYALRRLGEIAALSKVDLILDLNCNFKPEGFKWLASLLDLKFQWLELDCADPDALREIKDSTTTPICSGENLYTMRQYAPFLSRRAMDIASIDLLWNGLPESLRIAALADLHEINVCPHNFNSALGDAIAAHFCAIVPNLRMCEYDVDDVPWKYELVSHEHKIEKGVMTCSDKPGWGIDFNEEVLAAHPWPRQTKE